MSLDGAPFDELVRIVEALKKRIEVHGETLKVHETRTRMALIDPLLRALGWDTENPALLLPEYRSEIGRPDYALLSGPSKPPLALIEAKRLGESLAKHRLKMSTYAVDSGISYAGLTDGDQWEFYVCFGKAKQLEERRLFQVSIANDPATKCAAKLLPLWQSNFTSDQPTMEVLVVPVEPKPSTPAPAPTPSQPNPVVAPPSKGWIALTELGDPTRNPAPSAIRFGDGHEVSTKSWHSLLVESAKWLDRKAFLVWSGSPISSGGKRYLLNNIPVHGNGDHFRSSVQLSQSGVYLQTHGDAKRSVASAIKLFEHCDRNPAQVYVQCKVPPKG